MSCKEADADSALYDKTGGKRGTQKGVYKYLVFFQKRCNAIPEYKPEKVRKILDAFKRDNEELNALNALIWAILLTNSMIISSFGAQNAETSAHDINVTTDTRFLHELLKICGKVYFTEPESALRINNQSLEFDLVQYGLDKTVQRLVPFEKLVNHIRKSSEFSDVSGAKPTRFAEGIISRAEAMNPASMKTEVRRYVSRSRKRHRSPQLDHTSRRDWDVIEPQQSAVSYTAFPEIDAYERARSDNEYTQSPIQIGEGLDTREHEEEPVDAGSDDLGFED